MVRMIKCVGGDSHMKHESLGGAPGLVEARGDISRSGGRVGKRILIVEGNPQAQWDAARLLTVHGHRVVGTSSLEGAIALMSNWNVDLVIVDESLLVKELAHALEQEADLGDAADQTARLLSKVTAPEGGDITEAAFWRLLSQMAPHLKGRPHAAVWLACEEGKRPPQRPSGVRPAPALCVHETGGGRSDGASADAQAHEAHGLARNGSSRVFPGPPQAPGRYVETVADHVAVGRLYKPYATSNLLGAVWAAAPATRKPPVTRTRPTMKPAVQVEELPEAS